MRPPVGLILGLRFTSISKKWQDNPMWASKNAHQGHNSLWHRTYATTPWQNTKFLLGSPALFISCYVSLLPVLDVCVLKLTGLRHWWINLHTICQQHTHSDQVLTASYKRNLIKRTVVCRVFCNRTQHSSNSHNVSLHTIIYILLYIYTNLSSRSVTTWPTKYYKWL